MAQFITVEEALDLVKDGDQIVAASTACEPRAFLSKLHTIAPRINHVTINNCLGWTDFEFFTNKEYEDKFMLVSWFYGAALRKMPLRKNITVIPSHLRFCGKKRLSHIHTNIYVGMATYPDEHGKISLSLSNVYEREAIEAADIVILEVNKKAPWTFGEEMIIDESMVDYMIPVDYDMIVIPDKESTDKELAIGSILANEIHDGDCLQLGIGGIPNALAKSLYNKKHLGVATEMLTSEMMNLAKAGVIDNSMKQIDKGKMTASFIMGTPELYEWVNNNPAVYMKKCSTTNDPNVVAMNDNQVSVNTAIEVDLTGQVAAETIGARQFSGTGGATEMAVGAQMSKGGRSYLCLFSTQMVRNADDPTKRHEVSKIVPCFKPGTQVSLSRNDIEYLVTEYGCVNLLGTSLDERVRLIISVAAPQYREWLLEQAYEYGLLGKE